MKYTISINQKAVCDAGLNLDIVDMAIFDMLTTYTNSTACRRMNEGAKTFFNVPYTVVIDELPLCKITKPDSVYRRFQKLEMSGIINMHPENKKMKQVWFAWGRNYDRLHFGKQTGSKSGQPEKSGVRPDENPVQTGLESVLRPDENPPHNNTIPFTSPLCESENAHTQTAKSADLKTEDQTLSKRPAAPAVLSPGWNDFPKADTPDQLKAELSRFYQARPEDWKMTKEATPAQTWAADQTAAVVARFCDWAIGEGWERRTFKQINARLKRWFKEEPLMRPAATITPRLPIQPATPEPRGAAYQPFPKYDY